MTTILTKLLGRLPIGFLQLTHNPGRLMAALAGVAFANVLVFVQLGLAGSMLESVATPYKLFRPDLLMISASGAETLSDASKIPRQWMIRALAHPDVTGGTAIHLGQAKWLSGQQTSSSIQFIALSPEDEGFVRPDLSEPMASLALEDTALVDLRTRFIDMRIFESVSPEAPLTFEMQNRQLQAIGSVSIGGGFGGDGVFLVSDQTFFRLFPQRSSAAPNHILLELRAGANGERVAAELAQLFPDDSVRVRPLAAALAEEQRYQMTERPTGLIFAFGVGIGLIVGIVIAYQVLATDVADHIREYATFKAMGYRMRFFVGVILEEALILAAIGFWPGLLFSQLFYVTLAHLTNIPISMTTERALAVFVGTVVACSLSGLMAIRKLRAADPADLF
ncbi:FtsX-like permease family protein [Aquibium sp. ELW1220]|uniref:FtsX-like permease family protein n=1 Tax=Aquibium sp. ELW1220 TaxID=2976766 RepID=UPI0025AF5AE1|nr:FtsX-like permease family protein [Aquibium sp. ELW1220]MDN2583566.1 FtsX-like permease family protein [Aquibium sp. ELW1220]